MPLPVIVGVTVFVVVVLMAAAGYLIERNAEENEGGATKAGPG